MKKRLMASWKYLLLILTVEIFLANFVVTEVLHQIYRSSCRKNSLFKSSGKDTKLVPNTGDVIISTHALKNLSFCAKYCTDENGCESINYKKKPNSNLEQNCQLLSVDSTNSSATLQDVVGWRHYEPVLQPNPRCNSSSCQAGFVCVESCNNSAGYECYDIDECYSNPCKNNATCEDGVNAYSCNCLPGYEGALCDSEINECSSSPCKNSGTCTDKFNGYECTCAAGFTGSTCQTDVNECASSPCPSTHICTDGTNEYTCKCPAGFTGEKCEININECANSPCRNGGTCHDHVNYYTCSCTPEYTSTTCLYKRYGAAVTGSRGTITTPNYPLNYPAYRYCEWTITVSSNHRIEITFDSFDTYYDYLYLRNYDSSGSYIAILRSTPSLGPYASSGNRVWARFVSNYQSKGFSLSWREI